MADLRPSERRGDPTVAVLISWFVPGAGHLYLGRVRAAVVAFVVCEALFALGWYLSDGRVFEFLDPELRGPVSTILTPEFGNLGGLIAQLRVVGYGLDQPVPFPRYVHLGGILTALSGIASLIVMVHVHLDARTPIPTPATDAGRSRGLHPALLVASTWAIPGLGHWLQGRKLRALIVFVLIVGFFLAGTWMAAGTNLSRERHFYYWTGQFLVGLPAIAAELLSGRPPASGEISLGDVGLLYACMPGMLNILVMLDVYGVAERRWFGEPDSVPTASRPVEGESA